MTDREDTYAIGTLCGPLAKCPIYRMGLVCRLSIPGRGGKKGKVTTGTSGKGQLAGGRLVRTGEARATVDSNEALTFSRGRDATPSPRWPSGVCATLAPSPYHPSVVGAREIILKCSSIVLKCVSRPSRDVVSERTRCASLFLQGIPPRHHLALLRLIPRALAATHDAAPPPHPDVEVNRRLVLPLLLRRQDDLHRHALR